MANAGAISARIFPINIRKITSSLRGEPVVELPDFPAKRVEAT
jgi:hypothetical protein